MKTNFDSMMNCVVKDKPEEGLTLTTKPIPSDLIVMKC